MQSTNATAVIAHVGTVWGQLFDQLPYETFFLDDEFNVQYEAEQRLIDVLTTFALLTIIIACLGLAGLAAFSTAQRTKEIGIRKALGATSSSVVMLLSRDFLKPVAVAALLAGAIGWVVADNWAANFAYRTDISISMIAGCALVMVVIAAITVSFQAFRAAGADPVSSIRYE